MPDSDHQRKVIAGAKKIKKAAYTEANLKHTVWANKYEWFQKYDVDWYEVEPKRQFDYLTAQDFLPPQQQQKANNTFAHSLSSKLLRKSEGTASD